MTTEIINKMKNRRKSNLLKTSCKLKTQMNDIRKEIVKLSFQSIPNLTKHKELMAQLEQVKIKLKQINNLFANIDVFY